MGGAVPPGQYCCPITMQLMSCPVITKDGHSYEYDAIAKWIGEKGVCPQTRAPLTLEELAPNRSLKELIDEWVEKNCPLKPAVATFQNLRSIEPSTEV